MLWVYHEKIKSQQISRLWLLRLFGTMTSDISTDGDCDDDEEEEEEEDEEKEDWRMEISING